MQRRAIALVVLAIAVLATLATTTSAQPSEWRSIGPDGASILALSAQPGTSEVIYAGGFAALFRSTDGGATWRRPGSGLPVPDTGALLVTSGGDVFVGTFGAGVYRSTDGGGSFVAANSGAEAISVFALALDSSGGLWAATAGAGIYYSSDSGGGWEARSSGLTEDEVQDILPVGGDSLYAATPGGVFFSTDAGQSWSPRNQGISNLQQIKLTSFARRPDGGILYVASTTGATQAGGVFRSTDSGESWTLEATGLLNRRVADILIDSADPDILLAATETEQGAAGIYRSTDAGLTWAQVPGNPAARDTRVLVEAAGVFFAGSAGDDDSRGGVHRSADGLVFERSDRGMVVMRGRSVASYPGVGDALFVGAVGNFREPGGIYRSLDGGASWQEESRGLASPSVMVLQAASPTLRYAGTAAGVWRWIAGDERWESTALSSGTVHDLAQTGALGDSLSIWAATGAGVLFSPNGGLTFAPKNTGLSSLDVMTIAVDPLAPDVAYAGTGSSGVFRSSNGGDQWGPFSVDLGSLDVRDLVGDREGRVFAATAAGVFELAGTSWVERNNGLSDLDVKSLAAYRSERYAATASGVFRQSGETSEAWLPLNAGLPAQVEVHSVYADTAAGRLRLFAATNGDGLFLADEPTPVRLGRVEVIAAPGQVELRFSTSFEQDHLGFRIERRLPGESTFDRLTGEPLTGGPEYLFVDRDQRLVGGAEVDYRIFALSFNGTAELVADMSVAIPYGANEAPPAAAPSLAVYPNPFASHTWLQLGGGAGATIRIMDVAGRQVRTLAAGADGLIAWDGKSEAGVEVAAGVYLIRLAGRSGEALTRAIKIK